MQTELRFQVASEEEQKKIDSTAFPTFDALKKKNLTFLKQFFPELFKQIINRNFDQHSIFINRLSELNIVELSTGETLYPLESVNAQNTHASQSPRVTYSPGKASTSPANILHKKNDVVLGGEAHSPSESSDTLICLGLGAGVSVEKLALTTAYKNLIILEPSWDYFLASLYSVDWLNVNQVLDARGGMLAFDIEEATAVASSVSAIVSQLSLSQVDIYTHLHYPEYDALNQAVRFGYDLSELGEAVSKIAVEYKKHYHESPLFCHAFPTEFSTGTGNPASVDTLESNFKRNLKAFNSFFPDIAEAMKSYTPQNWSLTVNKEGDWNLFNQERNTFWYNCPVSRDVEASLEKFKAAPVETVPSTNINGGKLSHYTFYQYSKKITEVMNRFGKTRDVTPKEIPSLILLSLGTGEVHEKILKQYSVEYLYIIEPNLDFFFWSLHCIDWSEILSLFAASNRHLNFSLGDDGSHFSDDMQASMQQLNGFFLLNSFLFLERKHKALAPHVVEFRAELMNLITLSEHFHYAHYGLSHTYTNFPSGHTSISVRPLDENVDSGSMPVFVVGNGPSLDKDMAYLKAVQEKVVIVSCGTALRSLWKNGITPDFHAELEQNKCTYKIISQIPDSSYLKSINFLAPIDTHPNTVRLFNHHYGMPISLGGSMQFFNDLAGQVGLEPVLPKSPIPTVTNFAVSSLLALGLKNLVLIGVDLGFKDMSHHHSKDSLYYKEGKAEVIPDYEKRMGTKLMVRGNFEHYVYTKPEFKISAKNLGKAILSSNNVHVQNCSDGAKIEGAAAAKIGDIRLPEKGLKKEFITRLLDNSFSHDLTKELFSRLDCLQRDEKMEKHFRSLICTFEDIDGSFGSIKSVIEIQKSMLLRAYHEGSVVFYGLFVSTLNFAHATLLKVALSQENEKSQVQIVNEVRDLLVEMLNECFEEYQRAPLKLEDTVNTELAAF